MANDDRVLSQDEIDALLSSALTRGNTPPKAPPPSPQEETDEMWNAENTEGFTQAQLDTINAVIERLMADSEDLDAHVINEAINNEWREGVSEDELHDAAAKRLGVTHQERAVCR